MAQSQVLTVIGDADVRGIPGQVGASSTRAHLMGLLRMSPQLASEQVRLATALRQRYVIHAQGWETELGPDGRPQLRPPEWIDPERTAIRNTYWQRQTELRLDPGRDRDLDNAPGGDPDRDTRPE